MAGETLQEFLVIIGWETNEQQRQKFESALKNASESALKLGIALTGAAVAAAAAVEQMTEKYEALYYTSQRIGASSKFILDFQFAVSQLGGSADAAKASLENMAAHLRENPGTLVYLEKLGFSVNRLTGQLEYNDKLAAKAAETANSGKFGMAIMERYRAAAGMDENTFQAIIKHHDQVAKFMADNEHSLEVTGLDPDKAAEQATKLAQAARAAWRDIGNEYDSFQAKMSEPLTKGLQDLATWLHGNMPEITDFFHDQIEKTIHDIKETEKEFEWLGQQYHDATTKTEPQKEAFSNIKKKGFWRELWDEVWNGKSYPNKANPADLPAENANPSSFEGSDGFMIPGGAGGGVLKVNNAPIGSGNPLPVALVSISDSAISGSSGGVGGFLKGLGGRGGSSGGGDGGGISDSYGSGGKIPNAEGMARAKHMVGMLMSTYGLNREQAIGAAGVMGYESGNFTTMQEGNQPAGRGGWGYAQWTGPRRKAFMAWAQANGKDPRSQEANEGFFKYEVAQNPQYARAIERLKGITGADVARRSAYSFEHGFEGMTEGGPGIPAFGAHMARAAQYDRILGNDFAGGGDTTANSHNTNTVNQKVDIHVDGSSDAHQVATMVGAHLKHTSNDVVRQLQGAAQ
jgi:hypothetical protein